MKQTIKTAACLIGCVGTAYLFAVPAIYWWQNPELSQMQITQMFGHYYAAFCVASCFVAVLTSDKKGKKDGK